MDLKDLLKAAQDRVATIQALDGLESTLKGLRDEYEAKVTAAVAAAGFPSTANYEKAKAALVAKPAKVAKAPKVKTAKRAKSTKKVEIDQAEFTAAVKSGLTGDDLAKKFSCSVATVNNKKKAWGLTKSRE
jgi:hypothetical protein